MNAARLAELLAGMLFLAVGLYSIHSAADLVGDPGSSRVLLPGSLVYAIGVFALIDFLAGSRLLGIVESRHRMLPAKARLWRFSVANPEALLLSIPYLAAAAVSIVYLLGDPLAPLPSFLAAVVILFSSGVVGFFLLLRAFLDPPVSVAVARRAPALAYTIPWYVRLSRVSIRGQQPLLDAGRMIAGLLNVYRLEVLARTGRTGAEAEALAGALLGLGLAALPLAGVAYVLWGPAPALAAILLLPAPLAGYLILLYYRVNARRRLVEENLHWISLAAAISWPLSLGHAVARLAGVIRGLSVEARSLESSLEARGPVEGLAVYTGAHPSRELASLAVGLANVLATGGAVKDYLYERARSSLEDYRARLLRLVDEALVIAEVILLAAGLGVMVVLAAAIFLPSQSLVTLLVWSLPLIGALSILASGRMPAASIVFEDCRALAYGLLASSLTLAAMLGLDPPAWLGLGLVVLAFLSGYGLMYRRAKALAEGEERGLEAWLRGVMESMRSGASLIDALRCNPPAAGKDLTCVRVEEARRRLLSTGRFESRQAVSGLLRRVFTLIQLMLESGSASVRDVELLYRHISEYRAAWRRARERARIIVLLAYATPLLSSVLVELLAALAYRYARLASVVNTGFSPEAYSVVYDTARLAVVVSSLILGVMAARLVDGSYRSTLRVASVVAVALASLAIAPRLAALLF